MLLITVYQNTQDKRTKWFNPKIFWIRRVKELLKFLQSLVLDWKKISFTVLLSDTPFLSLKTDKSFVLVSFLVWGREQKINRELIVYDHYVC